MPGPPRVLGRQRGTRRGTSERVHSVVQTRSIRDKDITFPAINIQFDIVLFRIRSNRHRLQPGSWWWRARGARRATSPPQRRVHPTSGIRIAGTTAGRWARDDDARYDESRDTPFSSEEGGPRGEARIEALRISCARLMSPLRPRSLTHRRGRALGTWRGCTTAAGHVGLFLGVITKDRRDGGVPPHGRGCTRRGRAFSIRRCALLEAVDVIAL